ncbi:MFS transporter [Burkholderia cenocepacia]|uniref:MFS transporter n=1 Tax=Burkholderia cenocepacia TaxID=95486 RepID=UPI002AB694E5|nr:MFS transporter [Burkholderia cenocepacia]
MMEHRISVSSIAACIVGNCFEWFDFVVYSLFSFVIAKQYFPTSNEMVSMLLVLASFGLGYVVRPLGGIFWGAYADGAGRRAALVRISMLMATGTAIIAFTPTYASIGIAAPILIVTARLVQGFSAGGEFASATSLLIEYAPHNKRGVYASWQMASQVATIAVASLAVLLLTHYLGKGALEAWGWRTVFVFGILVGPLGYYMRTRLAESPEFEAFLRSQGRPAQAPLREVVAKHRSALACGAGVVLIGTSAFYLIMIYLPIFAARRLGIGMEAAQLATILCCVLQFGVCLWAGHLSDRYGRRAIMLPACVAYALFAYPLFERLITTPSFINLLIAQGVTNLFLGFISGPMPAALSELFPVEIRSSGVGLVYNVVGAVFGGLSPAIITWLIVVTGDNASPAWWALVTGLIGAIATFYLRLIATDRHDRTLESCCEITHKGC